MLSLDDQHGAYLGVRKEGDAENLPFPDGSFDVVVSSCGLMFAPDQQKVANEVDG